MLPDYFSIFSTIKIFILQYSFHPCLKFNLMLLSKLNTGGEEKETNVLLFDMEMPILLLPFLQICS